MMQMAAGVSDSESARLVADPAGHRSLAPSVKYAGRRATDVWAGRLFLVAFGLSLAGSFYVLAVKNASLPGPSGSPTLSPSLQRDVLQCEALNGAGRRLESTTGSDAHIWYVLGKDYEIPLTVFGAVVCTGVGWLLLMQTYARPVVWLTAVVKIAAWLWMGVETRRVGARQISTLCFLGAAGYAVAVVLARRQISRAARHLEVACTALREEPAVFAATSVIKTGFVLYLALYCVAAVDSHFVFEVDFDRHGTCTPVRPAWTATLLTFQTCMLVWVAYFAGAAKTSVTAMAVGSWYFAQRPRPRRPALAALSVTLTTSVGTLALGALLCTMAERLLSAARARFWWTSPGGCVLKCLLCSVQGLLETLSRYAIVAHALSGLPFFPAAARTRDLLRRHFVGAVVTDSVGADVLRLGAYTLSLAVGVATWAMVDEANGWHTLDPAGWHDIVASGGGSSVWSSLVFWAAALLFVWLTYYPLPAIFFVAIVSQCVLWGYLTGAYSAPLAAAFCAAVCHILLGYVADIVLDAMDVVFFCFAVQRDDGAAPTEERKAVYVMLTEMPNTLAVAGERAEKQRGGGASFPATVPVAQPVQYV